MAEDDSNTSLRSLPGLALLMGLALGGVGGLGIGAVMFKVVEDPAPKVVDTYCSPLFREGSDGLKDLLPSGLGTQIRVLDDGSQYRVQSVVRLWDEDGISFLDGLCITPAP